MPQLNFLEKQPSSAMFTDGDELIEHVLSFDELGTRTTQAVTRAALPAGGILETPTCINEFWTSKQRDANRLHEISYRACFKPQLPRFFIERLSRPGDRVYDPFMGRGTTLIEAALLGRVPLGCDVNPLSAIMTRPRLSPPELAAIQRRLEELDRHYAGHAPEDLLVFYHPDTLNEICALRDYFLKKEQSSGLDDVDEWVRMVAVNRLTGHSSGFFSVYTMPPNQAVSVKSQRKINERRGQVPPRREIRERILKKSKSLLSHCDAAVRRTLRRTAPGHLILTRHAAHTHEIEDDSVQLVVTSPPFLDVVNYAGDNWLRCWFCGIEPDSVDITIHSKLEEWQAAMTEVFHELARVLVPGGHVAFEVGEVRGGEVKLEEAVIPCGVAAGLEPLLVLINDQDFTKTANCWGVQNRTKGTNTNRVVVFRK